MTKSKVAILKELENGLSCTKLDVAECKAVEGKPFTDKNEIKRACDVTPVLFSSREWCRDRLVL
jgi:hypothetical protein